jgi:vacuolar protein 8
MSFLSSSIEVQRSLLNGNNDATLPFCGLSASKPIDFQRAAAAAFASMSLNQYGKTLLLAKGFVSPLLELCIHDDLYIQRDAMFCVANFAGSQEFCQFVVKEGGIATIKTSALSTKSDEVLRDAVRAMALFSVDVATKEIMISQEIPKVMWKLAKSSDSETQRFVALAVCNLCMGTREQKELLVKQDALRALLFLLRFPDLEIERCASLSVAALALGSNMNKAEIIDFGFVRPLLETITYPDTRICHCALLALNGIALGEQAETKDIVLRENGLASLFERINTNEHESIRSGIYLLGTLAESTKSRDALMAMDCMRLIVEKASLGPIEIKQAAAYFLCIVSECPEYHDEIMRVGGLESAVALASLVDKECQAFGSLALAFLAKNPTFQVSLVKMGAVRPLVTMIDANSDSKHYAALALVKLADNFENHITIAGKYQTKYRYVALFIQYFVISPPRCRSLIHSTRTFYLSEQGGIGALLSLGKSKISCANMQYKASLTVGHLAKNAYSQIDSSSPASHG